MRVYLLIFHSFSFFLRTFSSFFCFSLEEIFGFWRWRSIRLQRNGSLVSQDWFRNITNEIHELELDIDRLNEKNIGCFNCNFIVTFLFNKNNISMPRRFSRMFSRFNRANFTRNYIWCISRMQCLKHAWVNIVRSRSHAHVLIRTGTFW